jgi:triosephosphate isomerase
MRRGLIAGNWKMNLNRAQAMALAGAIAGGVEAASVDVLICPAFVHLETAMKCIAGSSVLLGAQDVYYQPDGAYTGEVSTSMIRDAGCHFVILGHSERRHVLGESDELINKKTRAALAAGLIPIVCVGERLDEREAGLTERVVQSQFEGSLAELDESQMCATVIAYEPVWAIGTGKTATPEQAQEVHADLRKMIHRRYNQSTRDAVRILYGGSVKPDNAAQLMAQPDIDGALVGGASLDAASFLNIVRAALGMFA